MRLQALHINIEIKKSLNAIHQAEFWLNDCRLSITNNIKSHREFEL